MIRKTHYQQQFGYDLVGNRLLSTSDKQMLLDPAGNILQESNDTQREYRYNAHNRISEYHENGQLKARYHYNSLGQRIHKAVIQADGSEQHTLFHYGQQGELLGESRLQDTNENSQSQNIVWLQMRPVVALDSTKNTDNNDTRIAWLHSDHLLTARAATDAHQNLIWRWHSDAFGVGEAESFTPKGKPSAQMLTLNLRFPGQYYDEENGLHYNYHRTYDPQHGRYTQSDPIGLMGGINTFAYVGGSPLAFFDWLGLEACEQAVVSGTWDSVTDARILTLHQDVQGAATAFINEVESALGITLRVTQALRTIEEQNDLYAQGRTAPGNIVTNAKGGDSYHNYGLAIDVVEIKDNKAIWDTDWEAISEIGIENGFTWGGSWSRFPDKPHFQMNFGLSIDQLKAGEIP